MRGVAALLTARAGALLGLLLLGRAAFAQADIELQAGVSTTRGSERTDLVAASWLPALDATPARVLRLDIGAMRFGGRARPESGDVVRVLYLGIRSERDSGLVWGLGVGVQSGRSQALSGDPQFVSSLGWRWNRFTLTLRHVSNAGLHGPNHGETALLAGLRF